MKGSHAMTAATTPRGSAAIVARVRPPTIALGALVVGVGAHLLLPEMRLLASPWRWSGALVVVVVVGVGLMLWAVRCLDGAGTTHDTQGTPTVLVTSGPLRFTRNPMYLGLTAALAGIGMIVGTAPLLLVPIVFWAVMNWVFVPHEEAVLERILGDQFRRYARAVRRWL